MYAEKDDEDEAAEKRAKEIVPAPPPPPEPESEDEAPPATVNKKQHGNGKQHDKSPVRGKSDIDQALFSLTSKKAAGGRDSSPVKTRAGRDSPLKNHASRQSPTRTRNNHVSRGSPTRRAHASRESPVRRNNHGARDSPVRKNHKSTTKKGDKTVRSEDDDANDTIQSLDDSRVNKQLGGKKPVQPRKYDSNDEYENVSKQPDKKLKRRVGKAKKKKHADESDDDEENNNNEDEENVASYSDTSENQEYYAKKGGNGNGNDTSRSNGKKYNSKPSRSTNAQRANTFSYPSFDYNDDNTVRLIVKSDGTKSALQTRGRYASLFDRQRLVLKSLYDIRRCRINNRDVSLYDKLDCQNRLFSTLFVTSILRQQIMKFNLTSKHRF
jgi:hypothetical protein